MKICHISSLHSRRDVRIFHKECVGAARSGHDVTLLVADGEGDKSAEGVSILDAGLRPARRGERFLRASRLMERKLRSIGADIYQIHDPELLPLARRLSRAGRAVVYDAHEDAPRQLLNKSYAENIPVRCLSRIFERYENRVAGGLAAVIGAVPEIAARFALLGVPSVDVNNYPRLEEFAAGQGNPTLKKGICYVGSLSMVRGVVDVAKAAILSRIPVTFAGQFESAQVERAVLGLPGADQFVRYAGMLDRAGIARLLSESVAGIVTLRPIPNYIESRPIKMFEYMAAGIPVIASNFPIWREILEGGDCGICVDPLDPRAIAEAIGKLAGDPAEVARLGRNGRRLVEERYNWASEERKLLDLYRNIGAAQRMGTAG